MDLTKEHGASSLDDAVREDDASHHGCEPRREFLALLGPCLPALNRFALAMCRDKRVCDHEAAKDLVSETVLKAFESFERVREHKAFLSYLFTIALRIHRHEQKRRAIWLPLAKEHANHHAETSAPDAGADTAQLYAALARLPKEQREAIVMSEIVGLSLAEVAEAQSASLSAVKTRVSRGRKRLGKLLGVEDDAVQSVTAFAPVSTNGLSTNGNGSYHARLAFQAKEKL
ncbi:MAG: RNA polymerase sigma factor [Bacteroidota bacterium]|nr:RNA polymerase sigma factor [Bacteroidota bacterium]MDP4232034.1 RNA polymerase sigma factor [Bacteroidota bacterium]MDP4241259.1 RNA polymerase sigma factor [Bacteroidota bacterium]MDP4286651.1 RNA polymerase sigma factor [Bacteroidota bacterium]